MRCLKGLILVPLLVGLFAMPQVASSALFEGTFSNVNDVQWFEVFQYTDYFGVWTDDTVTTFDPMLFIFDDTGLLLAWDDDSGTGVNAYISGGFPTYTDFYVALSSYNNRPLLTGGTSGYFLGWDNNGASSGNWGVNMENYQSASAISQPFATPEPFTTTMLLLAGGYIGLLGWRKRFKN